MALQFIFLAGCILFPSFLEGQPTDTQNEIVMGSSKDKDIEFMWVIQKWRVCGSMTYNPQTHQCCGWDPSPERSWSGYFIFNRDTQRCCFDHEKFFVILKNKEKTEIDDCDTYIRK